MLRLVKKKPMQGLVSALAIHLLLVANTDAQQPFRSGMPARPSISTPAPRSSMSAANQVISPNNTNNTPIWTGNNSGFPSSGFNSGGYGSNYNYSSWNSWGYNDWYGWNSGGWPYWNAFLSYNTINPAMNSFWTMPTLPYGMWSNAGMNPYWNMGFNPMWANSVNMNPYWNNMGVNPYWNYNTMSMMWNPYGLNNAMPVGNWNPLMPPMWNQNAQNGEQRR